MGKKPKQQSESEPQTPPKAKIRRRLYVSEVLNDYNAAANIKQDILDMYPEAGVAQLDGKMDLLDLEAVKIKRRAGYKFQLICYTKPQ